MVVAAPGTGFYSWSNSYDGGGGGWAIGLHTAANGPVYFNRDGTAAASGLHVSKPIGLVVTWTACASFGPAQVSGDTVGISFPAAPCAYPIFDVPDAPTGLAAR